jgi:hypothetical protein
MTAQGPIFHRPMRANTTMRAYSVSKIFTAAAVLQVIDSQCLSLDESINRFLDFCPYGPRITLRRLLADTAGVPNLRVCLPASASATRCATRGTRLHDAQFDSIRHSRVKAMDETPIKAGRKERGKMKLAYFWPVYGEQMRCAFRSFPHVTGRTCNAPSESITRRASLF